MKKSLLLLLMSLTAFLANAQNDEGRIAGNWYNEELDKLAINVYKSADNFWYAKIIESADRKKVGKVMLSKLSYHQQNKNYTGILTSPKNNMDINATIMLTSDGKLKLVGKKLFMTKTYLFNKR